MLEFFHADLHPKQFPYIHYPVKAGDAAENCSPIEWLSLDDYVAAKEDSVLYVRVGGDSMSDLDIHSGDLVVVDRLKQPRNGAIVLARLGCTYTIKRLKDLEMYGRRRKLSLVPANSRYQPRDVTARDDFEVIGVITYVVKKVR